MNRVDKSSVLEFIKSSKTPVNKRQILEATGYSGDFKYCMTALRKEHEEIQTIGNRFTQAYIWKPQAAVYSEMKNPEGYPDSTAGKAIANVMKSSGKYPMRQQFGEIWGNLDTRDDSEGLLIISAMEGNCIGYRVYPTKKPFMKEIFKWSDDMGWHYISILHPVSSYEGRLNKRLFSLSVTETEYLKEALNKVFPFTGDHVEIMTIEKPVEVIKEIEVEKIVEVPVEVERIVEKEVSSVDIELAVLRAKVEIYERLIFERKE